MIKAAILRVLRKLGYDLVPLHSTRSVYQRTVSGALDVEESERYTLVGYNQNSRLHYDAYRQIQELGNRRKTHQIWARKENIAAIANVIGDRIPSPRFGLCHGTRQGKEQAWFAEALGGGVEVLGTEISETAADYPDTIQWDFHEIKDEWVDNVDFIYSNSWDHAYDPWMVFRNWIRCLKPGGLMFLEHSDGHRPENVTELDPFGITVENLVYCLARDSDGSYAVSGVLEDLPAREENNRVVVVEKLRTSTIE